MTDQVSFADIQALARQESAKMRHFFVGVEHLFVALTQLRGGLTVSVLEQHGLSPRFARYSIRETVGRYENRRFWPGFPETPRMVKVLNLAKRYAGLHAVTERDLLLAILDEKDNIAVRVLEQMGAGIEALRLTAANWSAPLQPKAPEVTIHGDVELDADQAHVLRIMFRDYPEIRIIRELTGGYSGALVLLVRPIRVGGQSDAPVVVKVDDRHAILYERRRYDTHVKGTLPAATARLIDAPIVPDNTWCGGLKYTFVGQVSGTEPVSLRELAREHGPHKLTTLIQELMETFGPSWWLQRQPYRFGVWREYEHALPPALVLDALPDATPLSPTGRALNPLGAWSRDSSVMPGETVELRGFVAQKSDVERDVLYLAAGAQPEAINRAGKVEVRQFGLNGHVFFRGEFVERIVGRVVSTRDDLLLRSLQRLEPDFDLRMDRIPSGHDMLPDLPNPLMTVATLLERQVSGNLSTIHGDLHLGNILVGPRGNAWLIDFAWTREGHTLFDWALLELSFLVEVVSRLAPPGWEGAWGIIAMVDALNRGEDRALREKHQVGRALAALKAIREVAQQCLVAQDRWTEYHIALALLGLRLMDWRSEPIDGRRLAFLMAALSTAAVLSPRDPATSTDRHWMDTTTDMDKTELRMEPHDMDDSQS